MFTNQEGKLRAGWKILLTFVALYGVLQGIVLLLVQWVNVSSLFWIIVIQNIIFAGGAILIWKMCIKGSLKDMGLPGATKHIREVIAGLVAGALSMSLIFILLIVTGGAQVKSWTPYFSRDLFAYLMMFIVVGIGEEVLGRGYIMSVMRQTRSTPLVMIVSASLFSLMHMMNPFSGIIPFTNIFLVGMLFAYMYLKSNNIWMPIGYHIAWNYFQGNIYGFPVSGIEVGSLLTTEINAQHVINGGNFGPEGGIVATLVIGMGFIFVRWYYRNTLFRFYKI